MAQDGAVAAGQHGGKPPRLAAQDGVADRVDAAIEPMQMPVRHSPLDATAIEPDLVQLRATDHTVLPARDLRKSLVWGCWCTHTVH
jgi:hypothetical protein